MMLLVFTTILFEWPAVTHAQIDLSAHHTEYVWVPDLEKAFSGECYEIDKQTRGERFSAKVPHFNCRPEKLRYEWVAAKNETQGKCFEIAATGGAGNYSASVSDSLCYPDEREYALADGQCFVRGKLPNGRELVNRTSFEDCRPKKSELRFIYDEAKREGSCFEIDPKRPDGYRRRQDVRRCRPESTSFFFNAEDSRCYEVDRESGPTGYIDQVAREKCLETKMASYAFVNGECLQKALGPGGEDVIIKVALNRCRPEEVTHLFKFINRFHGECYEVDRKTQGELFKTRVATANCRPDEVLHSYVASEERCFELDAKTQGGEYVNRVANEFCQSESLPPSWRAQEGNSYEGKCLGEVKLGSGQKKEVSHRIEKCRPPKTRYEWVQLKPFNGKCYEVHAELGARGFSKAAPVRSCYPAETQVTFFNLPGQAVGTCAVVDKATGGQKFKRKVNARLCKEELGLVSPD